MRRFHVVFTFHRVWYFLNCGLYPQNSQLSIKLTLLAFKVLDCILRTHSCQSNECFWLLKYFRLSSWKEILEHSDTWCSLNASMNKICTSEENTALPKPKICPKNRLWDEILQRCGIKSWSISNSHEKTTKMTFTWNEHDVH